MTLQEGNKAEEGKEAISVRAVGKKWEETTVMVPL